jgi:hypothetical protein
VKKDIDCEVFQDQLDALGTGTLPDEGLSQLRAHAGACADCAMLLRMHEHLTAPPRADLEAAVPDEMVASMWPRIQRKLGGRSSLGGGRSWLVPAMAAAMVLLALGVGFMFVELQQLRGREQFLARQMVEQQRPASSNAVVRTAALAVRTAWERALARRQSVSIAQLGDMLRRVPENSTVLSASQLEALTRGAPSWAEAAWSDALSRVDLDDGIQAGELRIVLGALPVNPDRSMPTARILGLLRSGAAGSL